MKLLEESIIRRLTTQQLTDTLNKHKKWQDEEEGGERADFRNADIVGTDLRGACKKRFIKKYAARRR